MAPFDRSYDFPLVTGRRHMTGAGDGGHLTGANDLPSSWRNGRTSDYSDQAALLLMSL